MFTHLAARRGPILHCLVCGEEYVSTRAETKWPLCSTHGTNNMRGPILRLINEDRHQAHSRLVRAASGRGDPTYNGAWENRKFRRNLKRDGQIHRLILEGLEKGWPLWDHLPSEIQIWVIKESSPPRQETCEQCGNLFDRRRSGVNRFCSVPCNLAALHQSRRNLV